MARLKGYRHSEETRKKISQSNKGQIPWTAGKHHSLETKEKMRLSALGKKKSIQHIEKMRLNQLGKKASEETKKKMSEARKGIKRSTEVRARMSRLAKKGELSHAWKGGLNPLNKTLRKCFETRQWRSDVFHRDNFTCQECNTRGGELQADHIKPFSTILKDNNIKTFEEALTCAELWNINNGRTLCFTCHKKSSTWGGRTRN